MEDDDSTLVSLGNRTPVGALAHLDTAVLADTKPQASSPSPPPASARPIGSSLGRYVVLDELGRGGMGRVIRAYDPKLQREVAIKEVHRYALDEAAARRLVVEARAMAKLSHPHVVAVYDVEELPDRGVALVMEYVRGRTLRQWLAQAEPSAADVILRFVAAGRGLAAAHAAGLLHRDFKPANVLVGDDGSVKVTDFGLAKGTGSLDLPSMSSLSSESLSVDGMVLGTPRYMAPEHLRARPLTPAADQYSFCVALWEGLCGESPFPPSADAQTKEAGPPPWPGPAVPALIVRAIARGLAPSPANRWPSMQALLEALAWEPARRRNRWLLALGGASMLGSAGLVWHAHAEQQAARCTGAARQLAGIWDDERRALVEAAMLGVDAPYAALAWERTRHELDDYATDWTAMHVQTCEATTVRGEQSTEAMDLRMACLQRAAGDLEAVTSQLVNADAGVVQNAHRLTASLRPLSRCADLQALEAAVEPPLPHEADAVESIREQVRAARTAEASGRFDEARASLEAAKIAVASVEYGPVHTELALVEGLVLERVADYAASSAAYERAVELAARSEQLEELAEAATQLLFVVGSRELRATEVLRYAALVRGLAREPRQAARLAFALGTIYHRQGDHAEAEAEHRRNVTLLEQALGPEHVQVAMARINLADALLELGRREEAEAEHRRALARLDAILGPTHPTVAASRHNFALVLLAQERHIEAETELRQAVALMSQALGAGHPHVAAARDNLGHALRGQGRHDEAEVEHREALVLREKALGPEHPDVAGSHSNLGSLLAARGQYEAAEAEHRHALMLFERAFGPTNPNVAQSRAELGLILAAQGEREEAEAELRRALVVLEQVLPPDDPDLAEVRRELAALSAADGHPRDAPAEHTHGVE